MRRRLPRDVGVARRVDRDAEGIVDVHASEVGRIDESRTGRVQLGDEGIQRVGRPRRRNELDGPLERAARRREIGRSGLARDVGVAGSIDRDRAAEVEARAADVRGIDQRRARGVQLAHEDVADAGGAVQPRPKGAGRGWKIERLGRAHDIDVARRIHRDARAAFGTAPTEERRVLHAGVDDQRVVRVVALADREAVARLGASSMVQRVTAVHRDSRPGDLLICHWRRIPQHTRGRLDQQRAGGVQREAG